jgi:FAD/FMN-containing dehydrogenase
MTTTVTTLTGDTVRLDGTVDALARELDGELIRAGDERYDEARSLWNGLVDRSPALIVRCAGTHDVQAAVRFAVEHDLLLAVRGGGHNVAGTAIAEGGLVIDLTEMNNVEVDVGARLARAGGGATWADVDAATGPHALATPGGAVSDTGIGGLTLSGGIGWLRRKHGLSCDNLVAATLVAADGEVHEVDEDSDPELLWGLRGGGGNFGVVTEFTYRLHPVGPEVFFAFVLYPGEQTREVLQGYREYTEGLAEEVSPIAVCASVPEEEELPQESWGEPCVMLLGAAITDLERGEQLVAPLRELGEPLADHSGPMPYVEVQQLLDADYPQGMRYYWKSVFLPELSDRIIELTEEWAARRPSPLSTVDLWQLGGAMAQVPADATAYGDRDAPHLLAVEANWEDPADDQANIEWARSCTEAFNEVSSGREYLNFPGMLEERDATLRAAHGEDNYQRLVELKQLMDPHNRFRLHQNIPPTTEQP